MRTCEVVVRKELLVPWYTNALAQVRVYVALYTVYFPIVGVTALLPFPMQAPFSRQCEDRSNACLSLPEPVTAPIMPDSYAMTSSRKKTMKDCVKMKIP